MSLPPRELPGLDVAIDRLVFVPGSPDEDDEPGRFVYFITIRNDSSETVTIQGRKWVVTADNGNRIVVEGDGVVGETPRLEPGQSFSYNSAHPTRSNSVAEGAYFGTTDEGMLVFTRIPRFEMTLP